MSRVQTQAVVESVSELALRVRREVEGPRGKGVVTVTTMYKIRLIVGAYSGIGCMLFGFYEVCYRSWRVGPSLVLSGLILYGFTLWWHGTEEKKHLALKQVAEQQDTDTKGTDLSKQLHLLAGRLNL